MGHSHNHAHGEHRHHEHPVSSEKNYKLYLDVANTGALYVAISMFLMFAADSHAAFGDVVHLFADVGTYYLMAWIAKLCHDGRISPAQFNRRVGMLNTALLFAAAGGVFVEVMIAHRENTIVAMFLTGLVTYYGNHKQHQKLHHAHGHEEHAPTGVSGFRSIFQHVVVDKVFSGSVMVAAVWIGFQLPYHESIDRVIAWTLFALLMALGSRNVFDIYRGKSVNAHSH